MIFCEILNAVANLAIRMLWIIVRQAQNVLKWNQQALLSAWIQISERKLLFPNRLYENKQVTEWYCPMSTIYQWIKKNRFINISFLFLSMSMLSPSYSLKTGPSSSSTFMTYCLYWRWKRVIDGNNVLASQRSIMQFRFIRIIIILSYRGVSLLLYLCIFFFFQKSLHTPRVS